MLFSLWPTISPISDVLYHTPIVMEGEQSMQWLHLGQLCCTMSRCTEPAMPTHAKQVMPPYQLLYIMGKRITTGIRITMSHIAFSDCPAFYAAEYQVVLQQTQRTISIVPRLKMGRVNVRQVKESIVEGAIDQAIAEYRSGRKLSIRQAAESQGLPYSTLYGRLKGRLPRRKAHELDQTLGETEERAIVKQIEDMDRRCREC